MSISAPSLAISTLRLLREDRDFRATLCLCKMNYADLLAEQSRKPFLHPDELGSFKRLPESPRRESYLMGRFCAKQAVMQRQQMRRPTSILVSPGVFHQPVLHSPGAGEVQLSLSHCKGLGAALLFDEAHPMGIDIEVPDATKIAVIAPHLSAAETALIPHIHASDPAWAHTWLWTAKEALGKVLRTGLTIAIPLLEVCRLQRDGEILIAEFTHFPQYKVMSFTWEAAIVSIVLPRRTTMRMREASSPSATISSVWTVQ